MESKFLAVNTGSTSRKYSLYQKETELVRAIFESENAGITGRIWYQEIEHTVTINHLSEATQALMEWLVTQQVLHDVHDLTAVAVRIVAPGIFFQKHSLIDQEYLQNLHTAQDQAPLHTKPALEEITRFKETYPHIPLVGISDSAFHKDMPQKAALYAIDYQDSLNYGIRRFGYHGISLSSVVRSLATQWHQTPQRMIVCHLGGGSSITAIRDGKSIDTSMGLTPLEGLIMASRTGDIGPGVMIELMRRKQANAQQIEDYFHHHCGLKGISQLSGDMKQLIDLFRQGDKGAERALEMYVYRIQKYIGSYVAAMDGLDMLVFTGTIGERSAFIREHVCNGLHFLGINIDMNKNNKLDSQFDWIHSTTSQIEVVIIPTQEMKEMIRIGQEYLVTA